MPVDAEILAEIESLSKEKTVATDAAANEVASLKLALENCEAHIAKKTELLDGVSGAERLGRLQSLASEQLARDQISSRLSELSKTKPTP